MMPLNRLAHAIVCLAHYGEYPGYDVLMEVVRVLEGLMEAEKGAEDDHTIR